MLPRLLIEAPRGNKGSGVLVIHSWWGLTPSVRSYCLELAKHGFVAAAADLFGRRTATSIAEAQALRHAARSKPFYKILEDSIQELIQDRRVVSERLGVVGFSMGGHWAVWLSQQAALPIQSTVTYYSARAGNFAHSESSYLAHFAETDEWVSMNARRRMEMEIKRAGCHIQTFDYPGTKHWFAEVNHGNYHAASAKLALSRTVTHLRSSIGN